jgi:hypothetical protein
MLTLSVYSEYKYHAAGLHVSRPCTTQLAFVSAVRFECNAFLTHACSSTLYSSAVHAIAKNGVNRTPLLRSVFWSTYTTGSTIVLVRFGITLPEDYLYQKSCCPMFDSAPLPVVDLWYHSSLLTGVGTRYLVKSSCIVQNECLTCCFGVLALARNPVINLT